MNYMISLETLSTRIDAAIIEIGLAAFDDEKVVRGFKWYIHPEGHIDTETMKWWFGQIKQGAPNPFDNKLTLLREALKDMSSRMKELETVWAHRSTFDLPIIGFAFSQKNVPMPWASKQIRDTVTLSSFYPNVPRVESELKYCAESDARAQAQWMVNIFQAMKS